MCRARALSLATMSSSSVADAVLAAVRPFATTRFPAGSPFWVGGTDAATEGTWTWADETPWSYSRWSNGRQQPSGGTGANCLQQTTDTGYQGGWVDGSCVDRVPFLCSPPGGPPLLQPQPSPEPSPCVEFPV
jgi:hypothetical protein